LRGLGFELGRELSTEILRASSTFYNLFATVALVVSFHSLPTSVTVTVTVTVQAKKKPKRSVKSDKLSADLQKATEY
jgi:hypothetical protein